MNYLIWWVSQDDWQAIINNHLDTQLGRTYILEEFTARAGRPGRGRLWVHRTIRIDEIEWNERKPAARLAEKRGGIVIHAGDAEYVFDKPGFLTDLELNFINSLEQIK